MDKNTFIQLINYTLSFEKEIDNVEKLKIHIFESSLCSITYDIIHLILKSNFSSNQIDTIYWWLYESEKSNVPEMWDKEGNEIPTKTVDDLWNIITNYCD